MRMGPLPIPIYERNLCRELASVNGCAVSIAPLHMGIVRASDDDTYEDLYGSIDDDVQAVFTGEDDALRRVAAELGIVVCRGSEWRDLELVRLGGS